MSESITIKLIGGSWDGSSLISLTKDDLAVEAGRLYEGSFTTGGVISPEFFGLFSTAAPKLVSVAIDNRAPQSIARVIPSGSSEFREQVDLTPRFQSVVLGGGDQLAIASPSRGIVTLLVNDLSEPESFWYAMNRLEARSRYRRYRLTRTDGAAWTPNATPLTLNWTYNDSSRYSEETTASQGAVRVRDLFDSDYPGAYVWVRAAYLGAGTLEVLCAHPVSGETSSFQTGIANLKWSDGMWVGFDDLLAFRTPAPTPNNNVILDIELSPERERGVK